MIVGGELDDAGLDAWLDAAPSAPLQTAALDRCQLRFLVEWREMCPHTGQALRIGDAVALEVHTTGPEPTYLGPVDPSQRGKLQTALEYLTASRGVVVLSTRVLDGATLYTLPRVFAWAEGPS